MFEGPGGPYSYSDQGRGLRRILFSGLLLFLLSLILILLLSYYVFMRSPGPGVDRGIVRITIEPGMSFNQVAELLYREGIIREKDKFGWLAAHRDAMTRIQAGEFDLSADMTPVEVLDRLVSGRPVEYKITIPEGYNLKQIAGILEEQGIWSSNRFLELAASPEFAATLGVSRGTGGVAIPLEGYLFPDTYQFPRGTKEEQIIKFMVRRMDQVFGEEEFARADEMGMTRHEVLTLASMIEKETSVIEEMPLISSVFHRRLERGIKLDCDPTVIYGLKNFDGNLRRRDLERWTPYNTYLNPGLPPGPIASPGEEAIHAALYPADARYIYFVSRGDGTHVFSRTLAEHQEAIREYQLRRWR
jgi:UPF0755 protein